MPKRILPLTSAPAPLGPYSVATEANGFVFFAGQGGLDPDTGQVVSSDVAEQTHQTMRNIGAMLNELGLTYDDIVKTTIFLADISDFPTVNAAYAEYVGEAKPARTTVQAGALPGNGLLVEIDIIAAR